MAFELGRALLLADAVTPSALARALFAVATEGVPLPRALVALGAMRHDRLEEELARVEGPVVRHVVPLPELVAQLPPGLCSRMLALPIRQDARTGTVDVAVADARDPHAAREIGFFLKAPVRVVRAPLAAIEAALDRTVSASSTRAEALAAPIWMAEKPPMPPRQSTTPIWGTPIPRRSTMPPGPGTMRPTPQSSVPPSASPSMPPLLLTRPSLPRASLASPPLPTFASSGTLHSPQQPAMRPTLDEDGEPVLELRTNKMRGPMSFSESVTTAPFGFTEGGEVRVHRDSDAPGLPFPDASAVVSLMRGAGTRDQVLGALLSGVRAVARKVALFVLKKDVYIGWTCTPELGQVASIRLVQIPVALPSVFTTAAAGSTYLGPLYRNEASSQLLDVMEKVTRDVAIAAVRVLGRPIVLNVADELGDTALA
ncbi:MAG: FrgA, partial [Myxococcaceae bacterium]|nr:FrgA [Myxococcaceae bacterium]